MLGFRYVQKMEFDGPIIEGIAFEDGKEQNYVFFNVKSNMRDAYISLEISRGFSSIKCLDFFSDIISKYAVQMEISQKNESIMATFSIWNRLIDADKGIINEKLRVFSDNILMFLEDIRNECSKAAENDVKGIMGIYTNDLPNFISIEKCHSRLKEYSNQKKGTPKNFIDVLEAINTIHEMTMHSFTNLFQELSKNMNQESKES